MPALTIERLFTFADLVDDWSVISFGFNPSGAVTILAAERPNWRAYCRTWDFHRWEDQQPDHFEPAGRHRLIHLPTGEPYGGVHIIELPFEDDDLTGALPLRDDRWLLRSNLPRGASDFDYSFSELPPARMVDASGAVVDEWRIGRPSFVQTAPDGQFWVCFAGSDEPIPDCARADLWRTDAGGEVMFRFNRDAVLPSDAPPLTPWGTALGFINVVSAHEVWFRYEPANPRSKKYWLEERLVRLRDGVRMSVWPCSAIESKAPVRLAFADSIAVDKGHILLKGYSYPDDEIPRIASNRDQDRLYFVSLTTPRSMELFPLNADGEWIGEFRTQAQGSRLYLETEDALYLVDAATLPLP